MANAWPMVSLGDLLTPVQRVEAVDAAKEYRLLGIRLDGGGPFHRETKLGSQSAADRLYQVRTGDFIYSRLFAWRGAFGIISQELDGCYVSGEFPTFVPVTSKVDVRFLWLWFRLPTTLTMVEANCSGSTPLTRNRFKEHFFLAMEIPLPPLDEQRRIVARIEALAARVAEAQTLRREAIIQSNVLQSRAFDGILDNGKYDYQPLKNVLAEPLQNGLSIPASGIGQEGILFAKVGIVNSGRINPKETKRVDIYLPEDSSFWMKPGDIFVSRGNSLELVGRAAIYEEIPENCAFPDLLIRIRVDKTAIDPRYLVYYFQSAKARKYIESEASGTSPSMKKVSQPKLERMQIPVPPLEEQRRLVAYLDGLQAQVSALRGLQSESARELAALLPSVLDRAFKGEL